MTIAIGGMLKTTLVDFPARVASSIFLQGCNYRCGFCHNPGMVTPGPAPDPVDPEAVISLLRRRQGLVDGLCISGGEPLMQAGLGAFLRRVKAETGVAVKLDTNGSYPRRLAQLLDEQLVDFVALDIKAPPDLYGAATGLLHCDHRAVGESVAVLRARQVDFELRTTVVPGLAGREQLEEICRWVGGKGRYVLQRFRPDVTLDPASAALQPIPCDEMAVMAGLCAPHFDQVLVRGC